MGRKRARGSANALFALALWACFGVAVGCSSGHSLTSSGAAGSPMADASSDGGNATNDAGDSGGTDGGGADSAGGEAGVGADGSTPGTWDSALWDESVWQ